jgi:hypothetical protein
MLALFQDVLFCFWMHASIAAVHINACAVTRRSCLSKLLALNESRRTVLASNVCTIEHQTIVHP